MSQRSNHEALSLLLSVLQCEACHGTDWRTDPTRLSYHVYKVDEAGVPQLTAFENPRVELPRFVDSGSQEEAIVRVPFAEPGLYEVEFDLVHEMKSWFRDRGGRTCRLRCLVA